MNTTASWRFVGQHCFRSDGNMDTATIYLDNAIDEILSTVTFKMTQLVSMKYKPLLPGA